MNSFNQDLSIVIKTLDISLSDLSNELNFDLPTLSNWLNGKYEPDLRSKEDIYEYAYKHNVRLNLAYENPLKNLGSKQGFTLLYHGAKNEIIGEINLDKSRINNDFGKGFYLGESLKQSSLFVSEYPNSHIYSYGLYCDELIVKEYKVDLKWMLVIAYNRRRLDSYKNSNKLMKIVNEYKDADLIIAPIADNRMFDIIDEFVEGRITDNACTYALASLDLGKQYVLKTKKALSKLGFIKEYYLCNSERNDFINTRNYEALKRIDSIKDFRSKYRSGKYIEEIL